MITEKSDNNIFNREAMFRGTMLGVFWILMSAIYMMGLNTPILSYLFLAMFVASPFYAGYMVVNYRKRECNDKMTFVKAWLFLIIMYICASLLSAIVQYLYLVYIDNGYLFGVIQEQLDFLLNEPTIDDITKEALKQASEIWNNTTAKDIVVQILSSNVMLTGIIAPRKALFVKKNN